MPERKKKVPHPDGSGRMVDGTPLSWQTGGEHWNEYLADDGTVIRLKLVVTEIVRVDGEYDTEGNPIYLVGSTNILTVSTPEDLRKGGDEE